MGCVVTRPTLDEMYYDPMKRDRPATRSGEDMKKLREIARTHIEKAAAGDMQAIKELARPLLIDLGMHATMAHVMGSLAQAATAESRGAVIEAANQVALGFPRSTIEETQRWNGFIHLIFAARSHRGRSEDGAETSAICNRNWTGSGLGVACRRRRRENQDRFLAGGRGSILPGHADRG